MSASMQELRDKIAKARHIAEGVSFRHFNDKITGQKECIDRHFTSPSFHRFASQWNRKQRNAFDRMCQPHLACPHRTQSNYRSH